jgi:hypothetical protein
LRKSIYIKLLLVFGTVFYCCSEKSHSEIYTEKSTELITQIFSKKENYCSCLIVSDKTILESFAEEMPEFNVQKKLLKELNFESLTDLEYAINLSKKFELNDVMLNSNFKIIKRAEFDSILVRNNNDYVNGLAENRLSIIDSLCPKSVLFIEKPIFDKNFKIVYFDLQSGGCLRNPFGTYRLKNGKWNAD